MWPFYIFFGGILLALVLGVVLGYFVAAMVLGMLVLYLWCDVAMGYIVDILESKVQPKITNHFVDSLYIGLILLLYALPMLVFIFWMIGTAWILPFLGVYTILCLLFASYAAFVNRGEKYKP